MDSISDYFVFPADSYDAELVREGTDICLKLNLPEHVRRIVWLDRVLWHTLHSDECFFHGREALFPSRMKGKLEPREWRPLIASYKMYKFYRRNPPLRIFLTVPAMFLAFIVTALIVRIFATDLGITLVLTLLAIEGPLFVNLETQGTKNKKLQADLLASRAEGKEDFLVVLRKIRELRLSDIAKTERRKLSRHFSSKPSLSERIRNLELFNE